MKSTSESTSCGMSGSLYLFHCYSYLISRLFSNLVSNFFSDSNNITNATVWIFNSHIYNTSTVWFPIKRNLCFHSSFTKFFSDIIRKAHIRSALVGNRLDHSLKLISFFSPNYARSHALVFLSSVHQLICPDNEFRA